MKGSFAEFGAMKKEFDAMKAELIDFNMTKEQLRQMSELIQLTQRLQHDEMLRQVSGLIQSVKVQHAHSVGEFPVSSAYCRDATFKIGTCYSN